MYSLFSFGESRLLRDPVSAITGGIGMVGSLIGASGKAKAANQAAQIQAAAAAQAEQKVTDAAASVNPSITAAATAGGAGATTAAQTAADAANAQAATATQGVNAATGTANSLLDPYSQAGAQAEGTLQSGLAQGGDFNHAPTMADITIDPGYAFRQQQGELALSRSAAARGGAISGSALKDLANYSQGLASTEYSNAFNRYENDTQSRYSRLFGVGQQGQAAATQQGANTIGAAKYGGDTGLQANEYGGSLNSNAAQYAGTLGYQGATQVGNNTIGAAKSAADYLTQGANAQANGKVGAANAWGGAVSGITNTLGEVADTMPDSWFNSSAPKSNAGKSGNTVYV
jgi:hypothetical protein